MMQITVDVPEEKVAALVRTRISELFSGDARYRETGVRKLVQKIVDDAAVDAVRQARDAINKQLPAMATAAVNEALHADIAAAAKRGLNALRKLYVGFDPNKLTAEQRAWLENQIAGAARQDGEGK